MTVYYVKVMKDGNVYDCGGFYDESIARVTASLWECQGFEVIIKESEEE